ncbi:gluconate 2-dehydrogenase subunit 3 family protein [Sulfurimonas paralvinellae]|uniref:gluconate 2-dehydrogenase subunit 3 family protein n=1 Tax=Sulfurimonas paralvinellae TaxID=317658 RepID=UPI00186893F2|nr:gluconate 2-dehydrogenase subunit 3 family protein [Sulfurimonas paralvinellae]
MTNFSRRRFLAAGFLSGAVFLMDGCSLFGITTPIDTLRVMHRDLFPQAQKLGIETASYMSLVFNHSKISKSDKDFLKNGVKWLNEEAVKIYRSSYVKLSRNDRQNVLKNIAKTEWGESFIYDVMSYMFEAMLGDPIYGSNNKEAGWKWLAFEGGVPRPKEPFL